MPTRNGKRISLVAAIGERRELGLYRGIKGMPWDIPEDLEHFHRLTRGHVVIMGRRTFEIIGRPLDGRVNIVLTRNPAFQAAGVTVAHSIEEAIEIADELPDHEVMVIGGGQTFERALPLADTLHLTLIQGRFDADVFFPAYPDFTKVVTRQERVSGPYRFTFVELEREIATRPVKLDEL